MTVSASKKLLIKFVAEEGNYVFDLQRIEEYLIAIQKEQLLTKADEKTIFSVSAELLEFHSSLYLSLKEALKKPDCEIASIIGEKVCFFLFYLFIYLFNYLYYYYYYYLFFIYFNYNNLNLGIKK